MKRLLATIGVSGLALILAVAFGVALPDQAYAKYTTKTTTTIKLSVEKAHYKVRFHANADGVQGEMPDQTFTYGQAQALTTNTFERDGYIFAHWNTKASGLGIDYEDGATINLDVENGGIVNLYAQWTEDDEMHTKFEMPGTCVFHGSEIVRGDDGSLSGGYITGNNCIVSGIDWADGTHRYIDTGVKLYDEANYHKDFEIGFTIEEYDPSNQYKDPDNSAIQTTFVNSNLEDAGRHWPGIIIRRSNNNIEITQTIKKGDNYEKKSLTRGASSTTRIAIARIDGVIYYSFNGEAFRVLQDMNNTSDYFDVDVWFGASVKADGTPMRYLDATLTDLYIKVGETGSNKHIVSFDAGGIVENPEDVTVMGSNKIGSQLPSMPNSVETDEGRVYFGGWYTKQNGAGDLITEDSTIEEDMTLYANWRDNLNNCSVGGEKYSLLQECIDAAEPGATITLLDNIKEQVITIGSAKDITLDLNGRGLSDNAVAGQPVIESRGKLSIINGTITSSQRAGVINNLATGELYIGANARIIATGERQAVYNYGGKLTIDSNAYLSAVASQYAAVHNLNNGVTTIKSGTIISTGQVGVWNESGTLVIGVMDGAVNNTPMIRGKTYGVATNADIAMYDGKLMGRTGAIDNPDRIAASENGAVAVGWDPEVTEVVESLLYKILYYQNP